MRKKFSAALVYFMLWLVAVIAQVLILGTSGEIPAIWQDYKVYYSTLSLDLYLIILFYINYFALAPYMIKKSLYKEYIFTVIVAAIIGFILPIGFYSAWDWTMPGFPPNSVPYTSLGSIGAVAVMSIGLAIRGVLEWATLSDSDVETKKKVIAKEKEVEELKQKVSSLEEELEQTKAKVLEAENKLLKAELKQNNEHSTNE